MIRWGQQAPALPDAFRAAAEMFEGRVRSQGTLLETMLLPIMFLAHFDLRRILCYRHVYAVDFVDYEVVGMNSNRHAHVIEP